MQKLQKHLLNELYQLRQQGMKISDINPISALADTIADQLYAKDISKDSLQKLLNDLAGTLFDQQAQNLFEQSGLADDSASLEALLKQKIETLDFNKPLYRAVFTAHPVFAMRSEASQKLYTKAENIKHTGHVNNAIGDIDLQDIYASRTKLTLREEHGEAMRVLCHAREAIIFVNAALLNLRKEVSGTSWRDVLPVMFGVSSWVGYDLDGRSDISWSDSLYFRLKEKVLALQTYIQALRKLNSSAVHSIIICLQEEEQACIEDLDRMDQICKGDGEFVNTVNSLSHRKNKLVSSMAIVEQLHAIAKQCRLDQDAIKVMVIAADIKTHGFGIGEIHFRINAIQLRNAMRSVDGRSLSISGDAVSNRLLMERLAKRINQEKPWKINFSSLDNETATARRQLMLAAQFLKHIDSDQTIRLLIAECEKPITYLSALYLAHKFNIKDHLDISPLFETAFGLAHGAGMMEHLFRYRAVTDYIQQRGRVAVQTGFSDAGRFMGQIAANLAIERLQIKLIELCHKKFSSDVDLLIFNTHGESFGRGGARPKMANRQHFIMTPFVRNRALEHRRHICHESSFQGGDGYRLFGTTKLAKASMIALIKAELQASDIKWLKDPFYQDHDFALDFFLSLKHWHETLFNDPNYGVMLDVFGINLLPKTGSRPSKRAVQAGMERADPSKMRAIPHNAILQQLGFLATVISGFASAVQIDTEHFIEMYGQSPRLQQCVRHILQAKQLGSLNTVLAYGRLLDKGFWIDRAYHGRQPSSQRASRSLGAYLGSKHSTAAVEQIVWKLRDDLVDLYKLSKHLQLGDVRITGKERSELDLLHAIRIALIMDSLVKVSQLPRFSEGNQYTRSDLMQAAIRLDFATVRTIVETEFPVEKTTRAYHTIQETEDYPQTSYDTTQTQILLPLERNNEMIMQISQMISAHHGAHG